MSSFFSNWRNPVIWLVIGLPLVAVVAGIGLIVVSVRSGGSDAVPEDVRRTAQVQVADIGPDAVAARRQLRAVVRIDPEGGFVEVIPAAGDFDGAQLLVLTLVHPASQADDVELQLQRSDAGWRAPLRLDAGPAWNLVLEASDGSWRLQGRLVEGTLAAVVQPALRSPPAP
ncbi:FixH family protein [Lysobacter sp. A3-1-A15]|uniref:FixH family protein n=1 Tax=Novilysobacter viscosus TaxID=3098602 RepID=UPI002ED86F0F